MTAKVCGCCGEDLVKEPTEDELVCGNDNCRINMSNAPEVPDERKHPELARLCRELRARGVPCDGWTPVNDALGAIDRARRRNNP